MLLKEMSSRVEHLEGLLKQANDQMAAQRRDLEAEVTAERGKVQAVEHQLADVQRAREAERVEAAQQRAKDAASFQRTKAALTEGIEKEIAERQKMELRAQHAEQETEAVRVQVTSLNNIIEQMRASSHELQSKAEAVVSSAAAQSIEAAEEANKLRAELEQHRQSATALPALQKQLDVVNRQRQALLRKVEELEGKLGESLDENAAMATNLAAMRNHVTELSMQVVGGGHAGGALEGGEQEGEGGAAAAVASAGAGVGAGAVVLGTASPRNRKRASKVLRSPAASPALLKAMASPALAAVLSRVDTQVDRLNAQPDGAVVQTAAGAALARVMLTCVCRYVRRTRLLGALARWRTAIRWEDVRAMMTEKFDTINQLQEELQEAEEQAETSNIGCNTDATGAIVMEATADHRMLEAMERVRSEEKARLESTMNSLTSQFELLIHNNQAKEEVCAVFHGGCCKSLLSIAVALVPCTCRLTSVSHLPAGVGVTRHSKSWLRISTSSCSASNLALRSWRQTRLPPRCCSSGQQQRPLPPQSGLSAWKLLRHMVWTLVEGLMVVQMACLEARWRTRRSRSLPLPWLHLQAMPWLRLHRLRRSRPMPTVVPRCWHSWTRHLQPTDCRNVPQPTAAAAVAVVAAWQHLPLRRARSRWSSCRLGHHSTPLLARLPA